MKRLCCGVALLVAATLGTGCQTPLDRQQLELIQKWGEANQAFAFAVDTYREQVDRIVLKQLDAQRAAQDAVFTQFLATNSRDGALIETDDSDEPVLDANGGTKPMRREALQNELAVYHDQLAAIETNRAAWREVNAQLVSAIDRFKSLNAAGMETSQEIAEARASAQALLEASLSAMAGFAAGIGVGIAIP